VSNDGLPVIGYFEGPAQNAIDFSLVVAALGGWIKAFISAAERERLPMIAF
jgi:hypothetical protein